MPPLLLPLKPKEKSHKIESGPIRLQASLHSATSILYILHPKIQSSICFLLEAATSHRSPHNSPTVRCICILCHLHTPFSSGFETRDPLDARKPEAVAAVRTSRTQLLLMSPIETAEPSFARAIRRDQKGDLLDLASAGGGRLRV